MYNVGLLYGSIYYCLVYYIGILKKLNNLGDLCIIKIYLVIYIGYLLMKIIGILRSILNVNFYFRNYVFDNEI